jgi:hypothetical protein
MQVEARVPDGGEMLGDALRRDLLMPMVRDVEPDARSLLSPLIRGPPLESSLGRILRHVISASPQSSCPYSVRSEVMLPSENPSGIDMLRGAHLGLWRPTMVLGIPARSSIFASWRRGAPRWR